MRSRIAPIAIVAVLGAVLFAVLQSGDSSYTVRAKFRDAAGLKEDSQVKVGGVRVGTVRTLEVAPGNTALVTLALDKTQVGAHARAYVRPVNLLGEKYVDLEPGDLHRPQPSGALIPIARTGTPVELDQVLNTLDASTRVRLQLLLVENGRALAGRGAEFGATLHRLPRSLDQARALVGAFAQDNQALGRLIEESDRVIGAMAGKRRELGGLIRTTSGVLSALASRDEELAGSVREAAPAFAQLRHTLARLQVTARALGPAAAGLRDSAPQLAATLRALPGFTTAARPALRTTKRLSPTLTRLGVKATPVVRRLRPVAGRLNEFATALDPVSATFDQGIGDLLGYLEGWARAIQVGDGASHMFRNQLVLSPELVERLLSGYLRPGSSRRLRRPSRRPSQDASPPSSAPSPPSPMLPGPRLPRTPRLPDVAGDVRRQLEQLGQLTEQLPRPNADDDPSRLLDFLLQP